MSVLRLTKMTPDIYSQESRDFQLLCRIYDCVINGIKWDGDSTIKSIDTHNCRSEMLELLQTKLGFFTTKSFTMDELRMALEAFPDLVKSKGSLKAILGAVNTFLHTLHISTPVEIWCTKEETTIGSHVLKDHTLIIGIQASISDTTLLKEIFRYILPTGYDFYIYYYSKVTPIDRYVLHESAHLLFISEEIEDVIADEPDESNTPHPVSNTIGQFDDIKIAPKSSQYLSTYPGTFRGVLSSAPTDAVNGDTYIASSGLGTRNFFFYNGSGFTKRNFRGCYTDLSLVQNPVYRDVVILDNPNNNNYWYTKSYTTSYQGNYRGAYDYTSSVTNPADGDIISIHKATEIEWYVYYDGVWNKITNVYYTSWNNMVTTSNTLSIVRDYLVYVRLASYWMPITAPQKNFTPPVYFPVDWTNGGVSNEVIAQELEAQLNET